MVSMPSNPESKGPAPIAGGLIKDPRQIRALVSPTRQEIVDAIHSTGPLTISALAALLGRPADGLYFHVRTLESVGLLLRVGEAPTGKRTGGIYDVCSRPLRIQYDATRPAVAKAITAVSGSMVRLAHRDVVRAFRQKLVEPDGEHRNTWSGRVKGWLTRDQLAEVNRHWRAITEIFNNARPDDGVTGGTSLHAATFVMTPIPENKRAKTPRKKAAKPVHGKETP
jgi:DNA-binding transcriptional ArsR family regulator